MMREILFRGKRCDNGEWVKGYYIRAEHHWHKHGIHKDWITLGASANGGWFVLHNKYAVNAETVGQFAGLTDKNGKKIFEGDIGGYKQVDGAKRNGKPITCIGKVVYNVKTASFAVESKDETGCKYFDYFPIKDFEVIGNIHDNPELLRGEEDGK